MNPRHLGILLFIFTELTGCSANWHQPSWLRHFFLTVSTDGAEIRTYQVADVGGFVQLATTVVSPADANLVGRLSSNGKFFYYGSANHNSISQATVGSNLVLSLATTTVTKSSNTGAIAIHPSGRYLVAVSISGTNSISVISINPTTGELGSVVSEKTLGGVSSANQVRIHPQGDLVYAGSSSAWKGFRIDLNTGELTDLGVIGGMNTSTFVISPDGNFLFAGNRTTGNGNLAAYRINSATGVLTQTGATQSLGPVMTAIGVVADQKILLAYSNLNHVIGSNRIADDGSLTALTTLSHPFRFFVHPWVDALYDSKGTSFNVDAATGVLSIIDQQSSSNPNILTYGKSVIPISN
ncbi:MAG: beta-propeller fold lactonase family protein [Bacteriovoracia bacterium]